MKTMALGVGWVATIAVAFFLGQSLTAPAGDAGHDTLDRAEPEGRPEAAAPSLLGREDLRPSADPGGPVSSSPTAPGRGPDTLGEEDLAEATSDLESFLRALQDPDKANLLLRARFASLLAKGKEGHLEAVQLLDTLMKDQTLQRIFGGSDEQAARHIYPWIRFLVHHESQVVDLTETVFQTMAEDPRQFEGMDDDSLEVFTQGLAMVLPGVVDEKRIQRLRGYAETTLQAPEGSQPEAVTKNHSELKRVLETWAPPKTKEEILEILRRGEVDGRQLRKYLAQLKPEDLATVDLVPALAPLLEQGDYAAIRALESVGGDLGGVAALDAAVIEGAAKGRINYWHITRYLAATRRSGWPRAQGLIESGLQRGDRATDAFAQVLTHLNPKPDASYVQSVVDGYTLSKGTQNTLKAAFKLN